MRRWWALGACLVLAAGLAGCGPLTYEPPTYFKGHKPAFKPGSMWEVTTSPHVKNQNLVVVVRSGGVPVDACAIYDMPNRTLAAREDVKKSEQHLDALDHKIKEPDPVLKFKLPAKHPLRVLVFNSSDRSPDIELEIKRE